MPNWDVQWNLPVDVGNLGIDITKLPLPTGITIDSTGTSPAVRTDFAIQANTPSISRTLGVQCASCPSATAPKPPFTAPPATSTISLTAGTDLVSATLGSGSQIVLQLVNGFQFDPINPPGGSPGTITLTINNGGATIGTLTLQGPAATIPANQTKNFTVNLAGTINTSSALTVTMTMDSPASTTAVTMNPNHTFVVNSNATLKVSTATVNLTANPIQPSTSGMDLSGVDQLATRVEDVGTDQGEMILTVENPFTLGANATLKFTGTKKLDDQGNTRPMNAITKNVVLPAGGGASSTATVSVPFTGTELREMLGSNITATFGGTTIAGTTPVTPSAAITATARMRLRLFVKEVQ